VGSVHAPEALVAVVHEEGRRGILESFVKIMVDALFHEMSTIHGFPLAIPVPEEDGEIPRQRIRFFVPEPEFETRCETHDGALEEPLESEHLLDACPRGYQLITERNEHGKHVRNTGEPGEIGCL